MLRKNIRMRREYLFHKEQEKGTLDKFEKKLKLKNAMLAKKQIPTEIYQEQESLKKQLALDDENTIIPRTHFDDEYNQFYLREPKLLLTTSRNASSRLINFLKEMTLILPNSIRINRGAYVLKDLVEISQTKSFTDLILLHEHRGEPDGMIISHLPLGPTIYFGLKNTVLRHDLKEKPDPMSEALPHLVFHGFSTKLGERVCNILKHLFPRPKDESKRVITFANEGDLISFRHHIYEKTDFRTVELNEVGPRFDLKPYQISLGSLTQPEASKEWVLRPYMNTASKRKAL